MTKRYLKNSCCALDYIDIFPLSNSFNNIWNIFDDDDSEEDCFEKYVTGISGLIYQKLLVL